MYLIVSSSAFKTVYRKTIMSAVRTTYAAFLVILLETIILNSVKMQNIEISDGKVGRYLIEQPKSL